MSPLPMVRAGAMTLGLALAHAVAPAASAAPAAPARPVAAAPTATPLPYDPTVLAELSQGEVRWEVQSVPSDQTLRGVDFVDELHGWIVGGEGDDDCVILRTDDGGATWHGVGCPLPIRPEDVDFVDPATGWIIGRSGMILRSDDGGRTWGRQGAPTDDSLTAVFFHDRDRGWITNRAGRIFRTLDGGGRWRNENGKDGVGLFDVAFADALNGWAVGSTGVIVRSTDGGDSWHPVSSGTDARLYSVAFADGRRGWAAGNDIRHTVDGGDSWHRQYTPSKSIEEIDFADDLRGWAVGDEGHIFATADGGARWEREAAGLTGRGFRALATFGPRHMWAVASNGLVVHRYDPDAPLPPGHEPTAVPPTETPRPTATPTITPTPPPTATPTPSGPWLRLAWTGSGSDILVGPSGHHERVVTAVFGNMPASATITGTVEGAATFAGGGTTFASTVFPVNGAGEYRVVVVSTADAASGAPFTVRMGLEGATAQRAGRVAWQTAFPWMRAKP